jgi:hypothetical protein
MKKDVGVTSDDGASHWWRWHEAYADPDSSLSQRLNAVAARTQQAVQSAPEGEVRLVSACAGQAHDVVRALREHPRGDECRGRLVELDSSNAAVARESLRREGLDRLEVVESDAGITDVYEGATPANVVLFCGIFGNITDADVESAVRGVPQLCARGAEVIWTRHRNSPDLTPQIRRWFEDSGFEEVTFDSPSNLSFAVGTHRLVRTPPSLRPGVRLFTFR